MLFIFNGKGKSTMIESSGNHVATKQSSLSQERKYGASSLWYLVLVGLLIVSWTLTPLMAYAAPSQSVVSKPSPAKSAQPIKTPVVKPLPGKVTEPVKTPIQPLATGTIAFGSSAYSVNEGVGTTVFTLTRSGGTDGVATASIVLTNVTTSGADYVLPTTGGGNLDTSFLQSGVGANGDIYSVAVQPSDGKILIGGIFTAYNGTTSNYVARLNPDGSLDTSFLATGAGANDSLFSVVIQPSDGKILIMGAFTQYNGVNRAYIARLNTDGSLDSSFLATGVGANNFVNSAEVQSDGKIIIVGYFTQYNGTARNYVARLNIDGSLDTSFPATGVGANGVVLAVAIQNDGKIIIGGDLTVYSGVGRNRLARLDTNGNLDTNFLNTGAGADSSVSALAIQPSDQKIVVVGSFTTFNGLNRGRVVRLNTNGSVDTNFLAAGLGASNTVGWLAIQSDGKIVIGGDFTSYNGVNRGKVARLNTDGSLDTNFLNTGNGANGTVYGIAIQPSDGRIIIGGVFTQYNGVNRRAIVRLGTVGGLSVSWAAGEGGSKVISLTIVDDTMVESDESLVLGIGSVTAGATIGTPTTATVTIVNNDFIAATTLVLTSAPNPSTFGQNVVFTANLNAITATGTVTFTEGATVLGTANLVNGVATFNTSGLSGGSHVISATYGGNTNYGPSPSNSVTQMVTPLATALTLTSGPNPSGVGQPAVFTATITPTMATGTVTFREGATVLGTANLTSGVAIFSTTSLTFGSHTISATYAGNVNFNPSPSNPVNQEVIAAAKCTGRCPR